MLSKVNGTIGGGGSIGEEGVGGGQHGGHQGEQQQDAHVAGE